MIKIREKIFSFWGKYRSGILIFSKAVFIIAIILTIAMLWYNMYGYYFEPGETDYGILDTHCPLGANAVILNIHGGIVTYKPVIGSNEEETENTVPEEDITSADDVLAVFEEIKYRPEIKAVVLEIDSSGGSPVASEEIMRAVQKSGLVSVAFIRDWGLSGAYIVATAADKIFASEFSDVGGIGVTMSYLDYSGLNERDDIIYQQLVSAKFKDSGNPNKELTPEEKGLFIRDIKKMHEFIVETISQNRNLENGAVEKLADGSTLLGRDAKDAGLIDEVGGLEEVKDYLRPILSQEPIFCIY